MNIKDLLPPECTLCRTQGSSKKRILQTISDIAVDYLPGLEEDDVLGSLICREKMGSTGIGNGIAIPHGRLSGLTKVLAILVTTDSPISYDAVDDKPVDIFLALLVPEDQAEGHLQTLAAIASRLNDKGVVQKLRQAHSDQELYEAIT
ncbi:Protein-N(pi)-phosphohistidine--sugar phosphotransferase [Saliniradius amylolyticus]|uniref:Protein-N(Pi)-phosphohistidine--sugar phosphotransferase n=1 Tax=Saliniradius amylolyticus TaxID=2183582 RepID=A0A2S2E5N1_9ALTE|nr:PTS IIA-like nitrogen regulatory protein PtsN [Saliniradius amylolyticus]AWL12965.1 Protein-N(pi)-phosphohistidine--sugar phosphotransferase [Saliniradius amylolyticus]